MHLIHSPEFKRAPLQAVWKRLRWRVRWLLKRDPWVLPLGEGTEIAVPSSGAGALIYYQGLSEPPTAQLVQQCLKLGMVFMDVGAHIGEYTLLGSKLVGYRGEVHAFEPNPEIFPLLCSNVERNHLDNVVLRNFAVSNQDGESEFEAHREPSVSALRPTGRSSGRHKEAQARVYCVTTTQLDTYWRGRGKMFQLGKVDVEGAEMLVFLGSRRILALPEGQAPAWIFEYSPENLARFHYCPSDMFELLWSHGYTIYRFEAGQIEQIVPESMSRRRVNLIAAKTPIW
ncbi:MAG: FkbM family methyltransferase [Chloroflexi bacterium]|nr:FkbM family methyltransferase [Chloroflexota bacterium]